MSILREFKDDLFDMHEAAEIICVTTNRVGVMGAGVAKAAKTKYPALMFENYQRYCRNEAWGCEPLWFDDEALTYVVNLDTKEHWRDPSPLPLVEDSLRSLLDFAHRHDLRWIAMPPPGCGNGKLSWASQVKPLLERLLDEHEGEFDIAVCFKR